MLELEDRSLGMEPWVVGMRWMSVRLEVGRLWYRQLVQEQSRKDMLTLLGSLVGSPGGM